MQPMNLLLVSVFVSAFFGLTNSRHTIDVNSSLDALLVATSTTEEPFLLNSAANGDEFAVIMPSQPTTFIQPRSFVFKENGHLVVEERVFSSYFDGVIFLVRVLKTEKGPKSLHELFSNLDRPTKNRPINLVTQEIARDGLKGRQEEVRNSDNYYGESCYIKTQYFATSRNIYTVLAAARDEHNPHIEQFFSSLKLGKSALDYVMNYQRPPAVAQSAATLPTTVQSTLALPPEQVTRKAVIVWAPEVSVWPEFFQLNRPIVKVKAQMVLSASGQVMNVKLLVDSTSSINEKVITSLTNTRFIPAEKDGQPVSQMHTVEIVFRR